MRFRGLMPGGMLVVLVVLSVALGVQAASSGDPKPAKKPAAAKKTGTAAQAHHPKAAAEDASASEPESPTAPEPAALQQVAAARAAASQVVSAAPTAASQLAPAPHPVPAQPSLPPAVRPQAAAEPAAPKKISLGQATLLGIVEGLTEYLPVSSTGHLIVAGYWMGLTRQTDEPGPFGGRKLEKAPAIDAFEIVIQLGAVLAVLGLYRKRVGQMVRGLMGRNEQGLRLAMYLFLAFLPAAAVGLALHHKIEEHLFGPVPVAMALAIGGVLMIVVEHYFWTRRKDRIHEATQTRSMMPVGSGRAGSSGPVTLQTVQRVGSRFTRIETVMLWQAVAIGVAQCLSLWPGTSRSMITILAALVVGLDMAAAAEFSFLLALPTLGAATLYSMAKHRHELMASAGAGGLLVGLVVSGIVAALAVKWFVSFLTRHGLMPFGVYRIIAAGVLLLYFLG